MAGMFQDSRDDLFDVSIRRRGTLTEDQVLQHSSVISFRSGKQADLRNFSSKEEVYTSARDSSSAGIRDTFDTGHEFQLYKEKYELSHPKVKLYDATHNLIVEGPLWPSFVGGGNSFADLKGSIPPINTSFYGPKFIQRAIPTHPVAGLSQFLGELEQFPRFFFDVNTLRSRIDFFHNLGDEYLNAVFGWLPFVQDLVKFGRALKHGSDLLIQYSRDSGRIVRRRRSENAITDTILDGPQDSPYPFHYIATGDGFADIYARGGNCHADQTKVRTKYQKYWFSGAFTYYAPPLDLPTLSNLTQYETFLNYLAGSRITPKVLYDLTPWSWLADWVTNIGTNIGNAVDLQSDGLVMRYGYLMRETRFRDTVTTSIPENYFYGFRELDGQGVQSQSSITMKERVRATPYGFGLNPDAFSIKQWAILGALGLTLGTNKLRYR